MSFDFEDFPVYKETIKFIKQYECVACFQILLSKRLISTEQYNAFYKTLNDLAKQLSAMVR